jgi:iron complex transport system permease protein
MIDSSIDDDHTLSPKVRRAVRKWDSPIETEELKESFESYHSYVLRKWIFMIACIVICIVTMGYTLTVGSYNIGFFETYSILWEHITGNVTDAMKDMIIVDYRMPRIIGGIIAGASLAVAGAAMQSTLMNPLADPYTTGVSSGASFGATMAMVLGVSIGSGSLTIVLNAFVFSLVPTAIIVMFARMKASSPTVMIMAGIAVMYIFNAMTTVMMLMADPNDLQAVYEWQVGSLGRMTWDGVPVMVGVTVIGVIIVQFLSKKLNVLAAGDDMANSLGVSANNLRTIIMIVVALMAAAIVSFTGLIGFVGLVVPHVVRLFIGADNRYLIPASATFGAALLILADLVGRVIIAPATLQVGVITAFLGGPMFLWLILRKKSKLWS